MLQVYHSNRLELLFEILCAQRAAHTDADPFQADEILVANPGIGRWLSLQLSEREGIAANIEYPLPASYIWRLYRDHLPQVPEHSAFNKPRLQWTLMQLLEQLPDDDIYLPLQRYMQASDAEQRSIKQVQLAAKIADVFDQYLVYRPDWLLQWEAGQRPDTSPGNWQAAIWCALRNQLDEPHRATLHAAFCAAASNAKLAKSKLPERLYIFNVVSIPPSYLDVLTALSAHVPIDLYLLNPSVEFWDEITDRKRQLKLRPKHGQDTPLDDGNPLLAATGQLGQNALRLLHDRGQFIHEENFSVPSDKAGRLAQLQREVLTLTQPAAGDAALSAEHIEQFGFDFLAEDHSLEIHSAHSVLREVQVLHDQLLARFERLPDLKPADVVVMVPNVDKYTPAVAAVFGSAPRARYIPWEIADRSLSQTDPVVSLVRALLDLPQSDFKASEVLGWLAQPVLARRFALLEAESQELLARWVLDSGARRQLGNTPLAAGHNSPLNSWAFALRRLLAGYATAGSREAIGGVYPSAALEGGQAVLLGRLIDCLDQLAYWRDELQAARTMQAWLDAFNRLVDELLDADDDEAFAIQQLRECMSSLAENAEIAGYTEQLAPSAMLTLLDNALAGTSGKTQRFLTGRVTISSMVPLRSVPFRVVCLLGLNDGEFPRQNRPVSFDLIQAEPRKGDRSTREDDHYLFLEALLSARDELYLSWLGRNATDNSEQTPSVLLAELMDYFRHDQQGLKVQQHPLQAFSPRYFDRKDPNLFSYAAQWLPVAQTARGSSVPELPKPDAISVSAFMAFWRDPASHYCREVLRLGLQSSARLSADAEPFTLNNLEQYQQRAELLRGVLAVPPQAPETALAAAIGRGELPHGHFAQGVFAKSYEEIEALHQRVIAVSEQPLPPQPISLQAHGWTINGQIDNLYMANQQVVLMLVKPGQFKAADLVRLALSHLLGCAAAVLQSNSTFVARDKNYTFEHLDADTASDMLAPWLDYFAQGFVEPLPFFPNCCYSLAKDPEKLEKVEEAWLGSDRSTGESEREAYQLLWPQLANPLQLPKFTELTETLIEPLLALMREEKP